jgi:hypothetical protein
MGGGFAFFHVRRIAQSEVIGKGKVWGHLVPEKIASL